MPDLGQSFSPADQQAQNADPTLRRRRTPVQQALQTLNLQLPSYTGGNAVASDLLSGRTGGVVRQSAGVPRTQALLNAMMGGASTSGSEGTGQGRAVRYGGGFGGGGFGDSGGGRTVSAGPGAMPSTPGKPAAGGGGPQGIAGLLPGGKPPTGGGGLQGLLPGGAKPGKLPSVPKLPPSLVAKAPPINPNIPGGGLLDHAVSPPRTVAPPVNFNRGSNDVRFNTPIAQIPQAPVPPPQVAAPPQAPVTPLSFALPNGGTDWQAQANWYAAHQGQDAPGGGVYNNSAPVASAGSSGPPTRQGYY